MNTKVLVTGAAGMFCDAIVPTLRQAGYDVHPTDIDTRDDGIEYLDVRETARVFGMIEKLRPQYVIHAAAKTDVELCEREVDDAYLTNAVGTQNVALGCQRTGATMIYISTAGVFDGRSSEPYSEFDSPNPLNVYGKSKLIGEQFVERLLEKYFVIRTTWMFGGGLRKDKKFVAKILRQVATGKKEIFAVTDKAGTPTYTWDLAKKLVALLSGQCYGLYHIVCSGKATRFEVAHEILHNLGRNDIKLTPVGSEFFSKEYFAPRAESEMLRNYMLELRGSSDMRDWKSALREYLSDMLE